MRSFRSKLDLLLQESQLISISPRMFTFAYFNDVFSDDRMSPVWVVAGLGLVLRVPR